MSPARRVLLVSTSRGDARGMAAVGRAVGARGSDARIVETEVAAEVFPESLGDRTSVVELDTGLGRAREVGALIAGGHALADGVYQQVEAFRPDIAVIAGDRHEMLSVARSLLMGSVPIAHIDGGCVTTGSIDDSIRHAITKLSHLHLCTTELAGQRIRQLGEEDWRVHVVGDPELDHLIQNSKETSLEELARELGIGLEPPLVILSYHPPTSTPDAQAEELRAMLNALAPLGGTVVATRPGADVGSDLIVEELAKVASERAHFHLVPSLGHRFATLMAHADFMIGNSSSGLIESPTFHLPTVDIGRRQAGRVRPSNVLHAASPEDISVLVAQALQPDFRASIALDANPYGDGHSAERIAELIAVIDLDPLLEKRFVDHAL